MHSLAAKYDKTLARLAEDRWAVAAEEAERDAEQSAVQSSREQALAAEAAAKQEQAQLDEQVTLHILLTLLCGVYTIMQDAHLLRHAQVCMDAYLQRRST